MNKEEIEKAKDDLRFLNEGDYITRRMSNSKDILEEYIKQLEKDKEEAYWKGYVQKQKEAGEICKMCNYRNKYKEAREILDKVTYKLKQFKTDLKAYEKKNEYKKDISTELIGVRINAILKIIEGEKKNETI